MAVSHGVSGWPIEGVLHMGVSFVLSGVLRVTRRFYILGVSKGF
jgi:hypothetical protein